MKHTFRLKDYMDFRIRNSDGSIFHFIAPPNCTVQNIKIHYISVDIYRGIYRTDWNKNDISEKAEIPSCTSAQLALDHWPRHGNRQRPMACQGRPNPGQLWATASQDQARYCSPSPGLAPWDRQCHHWPRELAWLGKPPSLGQAWLRARPAGQTSNCQPPLGQKWSGVVGWVVLCTARSSPNKIMMPN
jgi:hypothetical protein